MYTYKQKKKKVLIKNKTIKNRVDSLLSEDDVTEHTKSFLHSLEKYINDNGGLTEKQYGALREIEVNINEKKSLGHREWLKTYDGEKKRIVKICAQYYEANPPYFAHLVQQILKDPDFIPTKTQYRAMCENKYAKKVLTAAFSKPVFKNGDVVQIRKTAPWELKKNLAIVIESKESPVVSAAKGAKPYIILPVGEKEFIECEERHLKKAKKT
tara:strand:+ start:1633 stop:2268 length:636 start_codon:yes stop_codon:yes gene_type:complete